MVDKLPDLFGAPYAPPLVLDGWLNDEIDGLLEVGGWTSAPISWPRRKKTGKASLILTDELARAVRIESVEAIGYWWGCGPQRCGCGGKHSELVGSQKGRGHFSKKGPEFLLRRQHWGGGGQDCQVAARRWLQRSAVSPRIPIRARPC